MWTVSSLCCVLGSLKSNMLVHALEKMLNMKNRVLVEECFNGSEDMAAVIR